MKYDFEVWPDLARIDKEGAVLEEGGPRVFSTIKGAMDAAMGEDGNKTVLIRSATYNENVRIPSNVSITTQAGATFHAPDDGPIFESADNR